MDKLLEKRAKEQAAVAQLTPAQRKERESWYTRLFPPHNIGGTTKGFTLFEAHDEDKLIELVSTWAPEMTAKIMPIHSYERAMEHYRKMKEHGVVF